MIWHKQEEMDRLSYKQNSRCEIYFETSSYMEMPIGHQFLLGAILGQSLIKRPYNTYAEDFL